MRVAQERAAFVGVGSNLDDPQTQVQRAIAALAAIDQCRVLAVSDSYRSEPIGKTDQPDFVNAVVKLATTLAAAEMLERLLQIELRAGRQRQERWGPRVLDLDLLLYDDLVQTSGAPILPHPRMHERAFVLVPLLDIATDILIPGHGTAKACLQTLGPQRLVRCGQPS